MSKPLTDKQLRDLTEKTQADWDSWPRRLVHGLMIAVTIIAILWQVAMYLERHTALLGTPTP